MLEDPPFDLLCPGRRPTGVGPVLLPANDDATPDWDGFAHLLGRVADTPLLPAVNLSPGGCDPLDASIRAEVVATTGAALGGATFLAGVRAEPGDDGGFDPARLAGAVQAVARHRGVPVLLPSPALAELSIDEHLGLVAWMGDWCERLVVADSPAARRPGGRGWGMGGFGALLEVEACVGVVDESWDRVAEWDRIRLRDEQRGSFQFFSGNARAVDQIMFGADHCLDLSAAIPDVIAARDDLWEAEDPEALTLQDSIQALATIVHRQPAAGAADALGRILHLRGWLPHDRILGSTVRRPDLEFELLGPLLERLDV